MEHQNQIMGYKEDQKQIVLMFLTKKMKKQIKKNQKVFGKALKHFLDNEFNIISKLFTLIYYKNILYFKFYFKLSMSKNF